MNTPERSSSLQQMGKILSEVGGYVAAVISFITLITGNIPGRFPKTAAVLGVVVTCFLFCTWRWSQITRQRTRRQPKTQAGTAKQHSSSFLEQLSAPLQSSKKDNYTMPLLRRRVETALLLVLAIFTVGWSGSALPNIAREFNPPRFSLEYPCDLNASTEALRVVIADFYETSSSEILFEERLYDEMSRQAQGDVQICRMKQVIQDRTQVMDAQEAVGSTVFIWGRSDRDAVDVNLEVRDWDILTEDIWSFRNDVQVFQASEASHLTFLTQYSLSWIRVVNGQYAGAREELEPAIANAREQAWVRENDNASDLADAYFLLGLIYEEDEALPELDRLQQAKASYDQAIDFGPDSHGAILNRGRVCMVLNELECAMQDFTSLIDIGSPLALDAYINRAYIQPTQELAELDLSSAIRIDPAQGYPLRGEVRLSWGDLQGAVSDFEMARELTPEDPFVYHNLGQAQLLSGDFAGALQTYEDSLPYLDHEFRSSIIEELNILEPPDGAEPSFRETVQRIQSLLEEAPLP
ncbi:MAG TPA: hypothetical protein VJ821_12400 [Anaerolineales bacterium]|nr:hypothetical protein [Anaerolineales bacterium]